MELGRCSARFSNSSTCRTISRCGPGTELGQLVAPGVVDCPHGADPHAEAALGAGPAGSVTATAMIPFCAYNSGPTFRGEIESKFKVSMVEWRARHGSEYT